LRHFTKLSFIICIKNKNKTIKKNRVINNKGYNFVKKIILKGIINKETLMFN